jgi:hypothetical protein
MLITLWLAEAHIRMIPTILHGAQNNMPARRRREHSHLWDCNASLRGSGGNIVGGKSGPLRAQERRMITDFIN